MSVHFSISLLVFLTVASWVYFWTYPSFYFSMAGAIQGLTLVFLVDVVLGPLLSFLVYNPTKPRKEIISDFVIIGMVQLSALVYGLHTLYQEKPSAVIVYPNSPATVVGHRELADFPQLGGLSKYSTLGTLPVAVYYPTKKGDDYTPLSEAIDILKSTDIATRKSIQMSSPDDINALHDIETKHGKVYVIGLMAKYHGAYIVLDENLQYLTKFGEKPIS